jgi:hypothetical protein
MAVQLSEHLAHAANDRQPLVYFPRLIESHADQKYDKIAFHLSSHSLFVDHREDPLSVEIEKFKFNRWVVVVDQHPMD